MLMIAGALLALSMQFVELDSSGLLSVRVIGQSGLRLANFENDLVLTDAKGRRRSWKNGEAVPYGEWYVTLRGYETRKITVNQPTVEAFVVFYLDRPVDSGWIATKIRQPSSAVGRCDRVVLVPVFSGATESRVGRFDAGEAILLVERIGLYSVVVFGGQEVCESWTQMIVRSGLRIQ